MWIASRHDWAYDWSQAGCSLRLNPAGSWWAATPEEDWPSEEEEIAEIRSKFAGEHGDRHQELVFIGQGLDQERIESLVDRCLLSDSEFAEGPHAWLELEDPLPPMELESEETA